MGGDGTPTSTNSNSAAAAVASSQQFQSHKACDSCYRSKLKCVGRDNPPCQRCVASGQECTFDGRRKSKITLVENRISTIEDQMEAMAQQLSLVQTQLNDLLASGGAGGAGGGGASGHYHQGKPDFRNTPLVPPAPSLPPPLPPLTRPDMSPLAADDAGHYHSLSVGRQRDRDRGHPAYSHHSHNQHQQHHHRDRDRDRSGEDRDRPNSQPHSHSHSHSQHDDDDNFDLDEDPILEAARLAPMAKMRGIADTRRAGVTSPERPTKRLRGVSNAGGDGGGVDEYGAALPSISSAIGPPTLADNGRGVDPVEIGLCSAGRGRQLVAAFFKYCHNSLPIFDPTYDTWDSLRARSALAVTTVMAVGAKFEEQTAEVVLLQRKCQEHAEWMAKNTLFAPPAPNEMDLEGIQAMVVLTAYGDTEWRPGGHAFRMAMERCLYRCLPHLVQTGMGARKSHAELEAERQVVVGARVWLLVCKFEYEMAFNHGRPVLIGHETSIPLGRQLLDHPLSTKLDGRIVSACELLAGRHRGHLVFGGPPHSSLARSIVEVQKDNEFFNAWLDRWMAYYDQMGLADGHFLRDILVTGKNHAILITNARLLYGVSTPRDVEALSPERREALNKAVQSASILVHMAVGSEGYKDHFLAANSNTHVAMVFAARLLIRFATLAPEAVDLRRAGREIEELAVILKRGPCHELAEQIQAVLTRARDRRVLPPRSHAASPRERERSGGEMHHHGGYGDAARGGHGGAHGYDGGRKQHGYGHHERSPQHQHQHPQQQQQQQQPEGAPPAPAAAFDLLSDFQFADELFNGAVLSDSDAMNLLQWFRDDWREDGYAEWP